MGVDRVVPLAVLAPLELVGLRYLVSGRQLELLFFEEQVEDLLCLGHVEVVFDGRLRSLEPRSRQRLGCLCPLNHRHIGLIG